MTAVNSQVDSLLVALQSATTLTDISDSENEYLQYDGAASLVKWLQMHDLLVAKDVLLKNEMTLHILSTLTNSSDFKKFTNELNLTIFKKIKFQAALKELQTNASKMYAYKKGDTLSVVSGMTALTTVSAIAPPFVVNDGLVVIIGISEYEGLPNLPGVIKDYENVINTFVKVWKYKILYKLDDNTLVYSNDINHVTNKSNYKSKWCIDEIELFVEEARKCVVTNKHNGLLLVISSHGDTGKIIYDSKGEICELDYIFSMFSPQAHQLIYSYQETPDQSRRLFAIPKIFFVDSCRGSLSAKVTNFTQDNNDTTSKDDETKNDPQSNTKDEKEKENEKQNEKEEEKKLTMELTTNTPPAQTTVDNTKSPDSSALTSIKLTTQSNKNESFVLKAVNKDEAQKVAAQMANFYKLYANVDGFAVADGTKNGGLFLRNVCKLFRDKNFVLRNTWNEMVFKIREYTKREATLIGLLNFTQLVENEATLERPVRFDSIYIADSGIYDTTYDYVDYPHIDDNDSKLGDLMLDDLFDVGPAEETKWKWVIANLSQTHSIYVLVEDEPTSENRNAMLDSLEDDMDGKIFKQHGFVRIDVNGDSQTFDTFWESVFVTLFSSKANVNGAENTEIFDRRKFSPSARRLYFKNETLQSIEDLRPNCEMVSNKFHRLQKYDSFNNQDNLSQKQCIICNDNNNDNELDVTRSYWYCRKCSYFVCYNCCHLIICKKIRVGLYIPLNITSIEQISQRKVKIGWKWTKQNENNLNDEDIECDFKLIRGTVAVNINTNKIRIVHLGNTSNTSDDDNHCIVDCNEALEKAELKESNDDFVNTEQQNLVTLECKMRIVDHTKDKNGNKTKLLFKSEWTRQKIAFSTNFKVSKYEAKHTEEYQNKFTYNKLSMPDYIGQNENGNGNIGNMINNNSINGQNNNSQNPNADSYSYHGKGYGVELKKSLASREESSPQHPSNNHVAQPHRINYNQNPTNFFDPHIQPLPGPHRINYNLPPNDFFDPNKPLSPKRQISAIELIEDFEWQCDICKQLNAMDALKCDTCGLTRARNAPKIRKGEGAQDGHGAHTGHRGNRNGAQENPNAQMIAIWTCPSCLFKNNEKEERCTVCRTRKPPNPSMSYERVQSADNSVQQQEDHDQGPFLALMDKRDVPENIFIKKGNQFTYDKMNAKFHWGQQAKQKDANLLSSEYIYQQQTMSKDLRLGIEKVEASIKNIDNYSNNNLDSWRCTLCTLKNAGNVTRCEACDTPRQTRGTLENDHENYADAHSSDSENEDADDRKQPSNNGAGNDGSDERSRSTSTAFDVLGHRGANFRLTQQQVKSQISRLKYTYASQAIRDQKGRLQVTRSDFEKVASDIATYNDNPPPIYATLKSVSKKLLKHDMRYRTLDIKNPKVIDRLLGFVGVIDFLQLLGFESDATGTKLVCKNKPQKQIVNDAVITLQVYKNKFGGAQFVNSRDNVTDDVDSASRSMAVMRSVAQDLDYDIVKVDEAEGSNDDVDYLTLKQLILWSTHENMRDTETMETLIMTHKQFCPSIVLLKELRNRFFVEPAYNIAQDTLKVIERGNRDRERKRLKVRKAIRDWMRHYWKEDFQDNFDGIRDELSEWCQEMQTKAPGLASKTIYREFSRLLKNGQNDMSAKDDNVDWASVQIDDKFNFNESTHDELADQITLMDYRIFRQIRARECIGQAWKKKGNKENSPNILKMIAQLNRLVVFVQIQILQEKKLRTRVKAIRKIIKMGERFRQSQNYNSLYGVFTALNSAPIQRLKDAWSRVHKDQKQAFENYRVIFSSELKYVNLRQICRNSVGPCIPYIGLFLQDLIFVDDGNIQHVELDKDSGKKNMINYKKYIRVADRIRSIQVYQTNGYNDIKQDLVVQKILLLQFDSFKDINEDDLWNMSTQAKENDKREAKKYI